MKDALVRSGRFAAQAITTKPVLRKRGHAPTPRDLSTTSLAMAITVVIIWALHHGAKIDVPPEVAAALATITGFGTARLFRY